MGRKPQRGDIIRSNGKTASFKDTKMIWVLICIIALTIAAGVFYILNSVTKQDVYYVLNTNMPSRTKITVEDLSPVTTSQGSAPQNAYGLSEVSQGNVFTKYPLHAGDIVASSNAGSLDTTNEGIPDNWVVTSFTPSSDDPVVENLQRGDYFDIMATSMKKADQKANPNGDDDANNIKVGQYVFRNVMVLDNPTTTTTGTGDKANGVTTQTKNSTTAFLVGMSPKNAAMLTYIVGNYDTKLVLSPRQTSYANPATLDALYKTFNFNEYVGANPNGIIASNCVDSATGEEIKEDCTDNTFAHQERDAFGVPYNAYSSERDEKGDPRPLTSFETQWCQQLFTDEYYSGRTSNKWKAQKEYCAKHTPKNASSENDFKKQYADQLKKLENDKKADITSKLGGKSGDLSTSGDLASGTTSDSNDNNKTSDKKVEEKKK